MAKTAAQRDAIITAMERGEKVTKADKQYIEQSAKQTGSVGSKAKKALKDYKEK